MIASLAVVVLDIINKRHDKETFQSDIKQSIDFQLSMLLFFP